MAVRLNVVMVQSPPPLAGAAEMAETLVGELIGRPGIDLILVDRLDRITESSTDHLTLHSLQGDLAILDWSSPAEQQRRLAKVGVEARLSPHPMAGVLSEELLADQPDVKRRLYAFDLTSVPDAGIVIDAITGLKESRAVKTFTLGGIAKPSPLPVAKPSPPTVAPSVASDISALPDKSSSDPATSSIAPLTDDASLDRLLDELDDLDV